MPDLEMLLRDVRPVPDTAWAARLDARVAARFPSPPPRWKTALIAVRDHLFTIGAVGAVASLIVVMVIAGVSSNSGDDSADRGNKMAAPASDSSDSGGASASSGSSGSIKKESGA